MQLCSLKYRNRHFIYTNNQPEVEEVDATVTEDNEAEADAEEEEEDAEEEEEEEEEEELVDPLDGLREECGKAPACAHAAHHFQECVERVTKEMEEPDYHEKAYKEDCIEEFFHLEHCINDCVAPKLFYKLK